MPAEFSGKRLDVSVAWIEQDQVYAFVQSLIPGPTRLSLLGMTEKHMRERVQQLTTTHNALTRALALPEADDVEADPVGLYDRHLAMNSTSWPTRRVISSSTCMSATQFTKLMSA